MLPQKSWLSAGKRTHPDASVRVMGPMGGPQMRRAWGLIISTDVAALAASTGPDGSPTVSG